MIKNNFDQQSIISNRKSSRLSNFNPMKNRTPKQDFTQPPIHAQNSPYYNQLTPTMTNMTTSSDGSSTNGNNYLLTKMETNESIDSNYSLQQQFKIELNLSKKEIELIRFTWNKMLLDEPIVKTNSSLPIPGGFSFNNSHNNQPIMNPPKSASTIASSLFCRQLYGNLLSMDGQLERLFPSIKHQAVAFAGVMSFTISQLENLTALNDYLENLGKRHSRILGIEPVMFELMGEALIQTFYERFGTRFTQDLEILWIKLYLYLSNSLLQFGIDPVLKLNKNDNLSSNASINSNLFKLNEINDFSSNNSTISSSINTLNSRNLKDDFYDVNEKKVSTGLKDKKDKSTIKKKKRDCVIQ